MKDTLITIIDSIDTDELIEIVTQDTSKTLTDAVDEVCQYRIPRGIIADSNGYDYPQAGDEETAQAVLNYLRGRIEDAEREEFCEED